MSEGHAHSWKEAHPVPVAWGAAVPRFEYSSEVDAPVADVFDWHTRAGALERLLPPWETIRVSVREGTPAEGGRVALQLRRGPVRVTWELRHRDFVPGRQLCDEQVAGPLDHWLHCLRFSPSHGDRTVLEDTVTCGFPAPPLGDLVMSGHAGRVLRRVFRYRHAVVGYDLMRHRRFAGRGPLRVAITGASGLIGSALGAFLESGGHRVFRLVRRAPRPRADEIHWSVAERRIDRAALEGMDAVVHLAGDSIAGGWWTQSRREVIRRSRVQGTALLCSALARLERPPRVLVSASAIGIYGDRGDALLHEGSEPGTGYLAEVARAWEAATAPAAAAGIRVVNLRIGLVLAGNGGALAPMLALFSLALGGPVGSGRQYWSWIDRDDLVGAIHHAIFKDALSGPVNAVAPSPVTNAEFAETLARVLRRPAVLPVPAAAIRLVLGQMGEELLLAGARVQCGKLRAHGFAFQHPNLEGSLRFQLGR